VPIVLKTTHVPSGETSWSRIARESLKIVAGEPVTAARSGSKPTRYRLERRSRLTYAILPPSRATLIQPAHCEGTVKGSGASTARPVSSSMRTLHRFIAPPRSLTK